MRTLLQSRAGSVDLVLRTGDAALLHPARPGLGPADLTCQLKAAGATSWTPKVLTAASWHEVGLGAYVLALDSAELDAPGPLFVHLAGQPALAPPVLSSLLECEVVTPRQFSATRPSLDRTVITGQIIGLDDRPIARATVTATLLQVPLLLAGVAVAGDAVVAASDDDGFFELPLLTGAAVDLEIPAARYRRTLVVPPPPAPGQPVRLFAIP